MKRILFIVLMLWGVAYGQVCADEDTVRSNTATMITYNSARINGTTAHFSGAVTSIQLKYVRVGQTDTVTSSGVAALRNITGLQASTQYYYYYKSICGSGSVSQTIGAYTFTTAANTILYADERPTRFHYAYIDSLLQIGAVDTSLYRAPTHPSIVYKSSDDTYYGYHLDCSCWQPLAIDSSGIIALLDNKVDSVTVSGDSLFYWKVGVSYGYILPSVATVWHTDGNAGIDTSTDFIGTTDNVDFPIKTNDVRRFTVNTSGALGIGASPDYGTSGYLLQSGGSGAAPAWVDHATLTTPVSNLTAATATNSINNANYGQTWAWNTLTGTAMTLSTSTTASSPGSTLLSIVRSGANASSGRTTYALSVANGHSGTNAVNYGLNSLANTGVTTYGGSFTSAGTSFAYGVNSSAQGTGANVAGTFSATGGTSNYAIIVPSSGGSVGIGTSAPDSLLTVEQGIWGKRGVRFSGLPSGVGTKAVRIDANGVLSMADTTAGVGLIVGTTTITSGTDTKVLYNNAGVLGEYTISGSGNVAMTTSPTFTTPALGTPSALVGTNITGTGTGFTAGAVNNALSIGAELISGGATTYNGSAAKTLGIQPTSVTNAMLAGSIDLTTKVTGILPAANGGTGVNNSTRTLTINSNAGTIDFTGASKTLTVSDNATVSDINTGDASLRLRVYQALGSTIKAEPVSGSMSNINALNGGTNQEFYVTAVYLPYAATITGVKWYQGTSGDYTANNYNGVGLYTYSGGTLTLVASSTNDGNIWKATANTWGSKAFSSTYSAAAGTYFIGMLWCRSATVADPSFGQTIATTNANVNLFDFTNSAKLSGTVSSLTSLPATQAMSGVTVSTRNRYLALY